MANFKGIDINGIKKMADEGLKAAQDGVKNFDAGEAMKKVADTATAGVDSVKKGIDGIKGQKPEPEESNAGKQFIKLLCYLAAADGAVTQDEKSKVEEIAREMDEDFLEYGENMIKECVEQIEQDSHDFGYLGAAKVGAQNTLRDLNASEQEKKLLVWNLFAVASADGIEEDESGFIEFVSEKMGIDQAIVEELSSYNSAIIELSAAKEQLETNDHSYREIEPQVNEAVTQEQIILQAAQALIADK